MIWGISSKQTALNQVGGVIDLPRLEPITDVNNSANQTARGVAAAAVTPSSYLNVVRDFYWTYSKPESRQEVPSIYLKEKRLIVNALVSQLKYSLGFAPDEASAAAAKLQQTATNLVGQNVFLDTVGALAQAGISAGSELSSQIGALIPDDNNSTIRNSNWLQPYAGLYITEPTSWEFLLPYFDDRAEHQGNIFSTEGSTNALAGAVQTLGNIAGEIAEVAAAIQNPTGITYIERAKFFNFPTDGEEISFSFPLINTGSLSYDDVINNWQLLFLLVYNNKPGRRSATQIEQPVIYEVEIPGVKFLPYCYMSSIDIKFQGSRRELPISVPFTEQQPVSNGAGGVTNVNIATSSKDIIAIIPDAYFVTITLKSMLGNTKNFMYHMIDSGNRTVVRVEE